MSLHMRFGKPDDVQWQIAASLKEEQKAWSVFTVACGHAIAPEKKNIDKSAVNTMMAFLITINP